MTDSLHITNNSPPSQGANGSSVEPAVNGIFTHQQSEIISSTQLASDVPFERQASESSDLLSECEALYISMKRFAETAACQTLSEIRSDADNLLEKSHSASSGIENQKLPTKSMPYPFPDSTETPVSTRKIEEMISQVVNVARFAGSAISDCESQIDHLFLLKFSEIVDTQIRSLEWSTRSAAPVQSPKSPMGKLLVEFHVKHRDFKRELKASWNMCQIRVGKACMELGSLEDTFVQHIDDLGNDPELERDEAFLLALRDTVSKMQEETRNIQEAFGGVKPDSVGTPPKNGMTLQDINDILKFGLIIILSISFISFKKIESSTNPFVKMVFSPKFLIIEMIYFLLQGIVARWDSRS